MGLALWEGSSDRRLSAIPSWGEGEQTRLKALKITVTKLSRKERKNHLPALYVTCPVSHPFTVAV